MRIETFKSLSCPATIVWEFRAMIYLFKKLSRYKNIMNTIIIAPNLNHNFACAQILIKNLPRRLTVKCLCRILIRFMPMLQKNIKMELNLRRDNISLELLHLSMRFLLDLKLIFAWVLKWIKPKMKVSLVMKTLVRAPKGFLHEDNRINGSK